MLYLLLIIIILLVLYRPIHYEGYADLTPYRYHWDIFKCYDRECVNDKVRKCREWCNTWKEEGGAENCRIGCLDYGDIQSEQMRLNIRNFNGILPLFNEYGLLADSDLLPSKPMVFK